MKILVPVDGSKYSRAAIDFIASRTTLIGASPEVELLNVQLPVPVRAARLIGKAAVTSYYEDESKKALKGALAALKRAGLAATSGYAVGHPPDEIARRADEDEVDLIAMGSHGHGALASLLLGSVTLGVLGRTRKPLLLLRGHGPAPAPRRGSPSCTARPTSPAAPCPTWPASRCRRTRPRKSRRCSSRRSTRPSAR
jgi:nucleotide-binding universal stress UspA family protein